jgi:2-octaprenylphenol hydroxylase
MIDAQRHDVIVAGAGLVGLALATALARAGLSVVLADRAPVAAPDPDPETWDLRVYAISPGSARFLRAIGAWQLLPAERVAPIEAMDVEGDAGSTLRFSAYDLGERALAWVVEERALRSALLQTAYAAGVTVAGGAPFVGLVFAPEQGTLLLGGEGDDPKALAAPLVVGADGIRSWVREAAGIMAEPKPYGQMGVVANFASERAHHGIARQWFRADGSVLAWLPMPGRRLSIVWSAPDALASELLALAPDALAARVGEAGAHALGALTPIGEAAAFPLALLRLPSTVAHRLALVGDAAHGVHPLAGQGVNLGFGDALALADVLAERGPISDPGAPLLLARYARRRRAPVLAMQAVTDGLTRLFGPSVPWLSIVRNAGMATVDRLALVKRALAQPALR